ncbi:MAG: class I SAM-dependent methyltransferase [Chloroflexi bacterium]|nr:class I SAM-dependent methyltransferase [Chloroflexota bacterium]
MTSYKAKDHYQQEEIAAAYDAERFRGLRGRSVDWLERRLLDKAMEGLEARLQVLDLPVGTGRMARYLTSKGHHVVGSDISLAMMEVGEKLSEGGAVLVRGDGEALPFADDSFDVAMCFRLLVHLPEEARLNVLRELGRVARERVIAVYQPHRLALWWLFYGLLLRRRLPRYFVPPGDLPDEFAKAGLRLVRSHTLLRGVFMEQAYVLESARS